MVTILLVVAVDSAQVIGLLLFGIVIWFWILFDEKDRIHFQITAIRIPRSKNAKYYITINIYGGCPVDYEDDNHSSITKHLKPSQVHGLCNDLRSEISYMFYYYSDIFNLDNCYPVALWYVLCSFRCLVKRDLV